MRPGLSRAIPMGFVGFLLGALIVIVLRGLQGLDPLWAAGPGIVLSVFTTAGFFVWGMGAFDSRLSVHGDHEVEEAVQEELAAESAQPRSLLLSATWQIATFVLVLVIILGGFAALPGGLALTQTVVPGASLTSVGFATMPLPFGGPDVQVSTLVIFAVFILWAFISLVAAAAGIGFVITYLARGLTEAQTAGGGAAALPAPAPEPTIQRAPREALVTFFGVLITFVGLLLLLNFVIGLIFPAMQLPGASLMFDAPTQIALVALLAAILLTLAIWGRERFLFVEPFIVVFVILYLVFYYVAIGLILPQPSLPGLNLILTPAQTLVFLSLVNALIFTLLILRPALVLQTVGIVARWVAYQMRRLPHILQ